MHASYQIAPSACHGRKDMKTASSEGIFVRQKTVKTASSEGIFIRQKTVKTASSEGIYIYKIEDSEDGVK